MFNNVILKISGEELAGDGAERFDPTVVNKVVGEVCALTDKNIKVSLVVGGGNFWRGRDADGMDRTRADSIGMLATVMNALYLAEAFAGVGKKATVMTPFPVGVMTEVYSTEKARVALARGETLIFAGRTGHPFFSTDTIAAIRAAELNDDAILYAKPVDGFYTEDPKTVKDAVKIPVLTYERVIHDGLKAIDLTAAAFCQSLNVKPVSVLFKLALEGSIVTAATGCEDELLKVGSIVRS